MTSQTLSQVTLKSIENYRTAATQAVVAYRLGGTVWCACEWRAEEERLSAHRQARAPHRAPHERNSRQRLRRWS